MDRDTTIKLLPSMVDEIEFQDCFCGAGMQRNLPATWEMCGVHKRCQRMREALAAVLTQN